MAAWQSWLVPDHCIDPKTVDDRSQQWRSRVVAALSGACEGMQTDASQQILCCDSSAALGMIRRQNETRRAESVLPATVERTTRSETCTSRNE